MTPEGEMTDPSALDAIKKLEGLGYIDSFELKDNRLHSLKFDRWYSVEHLTLEAALRFEGASDPDDSSVIYAVKAVDGNAGLVIDSYGIGGNPILEQFIHSLADRRAQHRCKLA